MTTIKITKRLLCFKRTDDLVDNRSGDDKTIDAGAAKRKTKQTGTSLNYQRHFHLAFETTFIGRNCRDSGVENVVQSCTCLLAIYIFLFLFIITVAD